MEDRVKVLEDQQNHLQRELVELRLELAKIAIRQETILERLDKYSGGINRGLWILGGGVLVSFVSWITGGGLER